MSSRKHKVLITFALILITLTLFSLAQIASMRNNQLGNDAVLPSKYEAPELPSTDPPVITEFNETYVPNLNLWDLSINVTRSASLHDFGYFTIEDKYYIQKNDDITMPIFRFAYPTLWFQHLVNIKAETYWDTMDQIPLNESEVYLEHKTANYAFYAVKLTPAIDNSSTYIINIHGTFLPLYKLFEYIDSSSFKRNGVVFNYSIIPFITKQIDICKTTFNKATEGGFINDLVQPGDATIGSVTVIFEDQEDVQAYNFSNRYDPNDNSFPYRAQIGTFLNHVPPTEVIDYKRTVILENWHWAKVYETITIKSNGISPEDFYYNIADSRFYASFALTRFQLAIDNAQNYKAYDELGKLVPAEGDKDFDKSYLYVYLRGPLIGGDTKTINLEYMLQLGDILQYEKTEYLLKTLAVPKCDFHISNLNLTIILPQGANFETITFGNKPITYTESRTSTFLKLGRRQTIAINAVNITTFSNFELKVSYYMNDLAYYIQPLTFSLIFFVACLLYIGASLMRKDVLEKVIITKDEKEEIPVEHIQTFVEKYEEKTALQKRITELDEDRKKKKIKSIEYEKQRKILESKMRDLVKELDNTKKSLKEIGRKYIDIIQKIEINEEKRVSVERSIQDLRIRYIREKQISKDAYIRILRDYQNQLEKFERDIDREIINLRLLIEHEAKNK